MNFQQSPQTLQSQRYGCAVRHSVGGIACDIRGKLAGRESCATTHSTAGSAAGSAGGSTAGSAPATCQRSGTVNTVAANDLPKHQRDRSRDHVQARNETTISNTDFPTPTHQKVTTKPTHFAHPPCWHPPPPTPTFLHHQAEKSPLQQYVLSFNPKERAYYLNTGNRVDWYPSLWVCLNIWDPTHEDYQVAQRLTWLGYGSRG